MPKRVLVPLADGCEPLEALSLVDPLRRGGLEVVAASVSGRPDVACAHGVRLLADAAFDPAAAAAFDAIALPGGMGGTRALCASEAVLGALRAAAARGAVLAAVCAAPTALDAAGLLAGRRFCCYPGIERTLSGAGTYVPGVPVVVDGTLVTGTGPATALPFALALLDVLGGPARDVAAGMLASDAVLC